MKIDEFKVENGVVKVRKPFWHAKAYLEVTYLDGLRTPWAKLYDEFGNKAVGNPNPMELFFLDDGKDDWEEATTDGPERDPEAD